MNSRTIESMLRRVKNLNSSVLTYEPMAGDDIESSARDCVYLSKKYSKTVNFNFNGLEISVNTFDSTESVVSQWQALSDKRHAEYLASPEHAAYLAKRTKELRKAQGQVDKLMVSFPSVLNDQKKLCKWLNEFSPLADDIDIKCDLAFLSSSMKNAGYVADAGVIDKAASEESKATQKSILMSSRVAFGNYLIGQAISCMDKGLPPHHMFCTFYERDYLPLVGAEIGIITENA